MAYGRGLRFFKEVHVGTLIQYLSLADLLARGADETERSIVQTAREQQARLVVLDGYRGICRLLGDEPASTDFLYLLGSKLALLGSTTVVATEGEVDAPERYGEMTVSDAVIGLTRRRHGERYRRTLDVVKVRGMARGYRVTMAIHGRDALDRIEEARPDLTITDLMMPVMGGVELNRELETRAERSGDGFGSRHGGGCAPRRGVRTGRRASSAEIPCTLTHLCAHQDAGN